MRASVPATNTSSLSVLRDTPWIGDPGAPRPLFSCHQPCHQSRNSGCHAAVQITPPRSVTKMSSLSVLRLIASTELLGGSRGLTRTEDSGKGLSGFGPGIDEDVVEGYAASTNCLNTGNGLPESTVTLR